MFETVVPYTPKARSRLCRLCSRRISSICRIRSRDAPSRVTAEKGKKNHQDVLQIIGCLWKKHKHAQTLPCFIFGEGGGIYVTDFLLNRFYLKSLWRKWSRSDVKSSLSSFFHRSLDLYVAMNLFISIKVLKVLLLNLLPGSDQSDFVLSLSNCTIQTAQIIELIECN